MVVGPERIAIHFAQSYYKINIIEVTEFGEIEALHVPLVWLAHFNAWRSGPTRLADSLIDILAATDRAATEAYRVMEEEAYRNFENESRWTDE